MSKRSFSSASTNFFLLLVLVVIFSSCGKEQIDESLTPVEEPQTTKGLADYPSEITTDNWEEFIYAPQAVIDHFAAKEAAEVQRTKTETKEPTDVEDSQLNSNWIYAQVSAFNGSWTGISGVTVSMGTCTTTSFASVPFNYFLEVESSCENSALCMSYSTDIRNGVSTFDLVLISRHILQIDCFISPQQYLAADADRNGVIDQADIDAIRDLILFNTNTFPGNTPGIRFIPESDYQDLQFAIFGCSIDPIALSLIGFTPDCLARNSNDYELDIDPNTDNAYRRVIKTGDINGSFSF